MKEAKKVFISYRRADSALYAELLYGRLDPVFGKYAIFFDREGIDLGDRFVQVIDERIAGSDVLLALIGPGWLSVVNDKGQPRLHDPGDYVRREIASALKQSKWVIPVLVRGASMPKAADLPPDLQRLADLSAVSIGELDSGPDIDRLIQRLQGHRQPLIRLFADARRRRRIGWTTAVVVLAAIAAYWVSLADSLMLDVRAESQLMRWGDALSPPRSIDLARRITIGPPAEARFGPFGPSWRGRHADLIARLAEAGARVVAFDLLIDEPTSLDDRLAEAARSARDRGTVVVFGVRQALPEGSPLRGAVATSHLCIGKRLGYAAVAPLAVHDGSGFHASLSLAAYLGGRRLLRIDQDPRRILAEGATAGAELDAIPYSRFEETRTGLACLESLQAGNPEAPFRIAEQIIRFTPLGELRARTLGYEQIFDLEPDVLAGQFGGKVVFVGSEESEDRKKVFGDDPGQQRSGFDIHVDSFNTLAAGTDIRGLRPSLQFLLTIGMGSLGPLVVWSARSLPPLRRTGLTLACRLLIIGLYAALAIWVYVEQEILLAVIYDLGAFLLAYWAAARYAGQAGIWKS